VNFLKTIIEDNGQLLVLKMLIYCIVRRTPERNCWWCWWTWAWVDRMSQVSVSYTEKCCWCRICC